ncbi:MAG: phospholipase D-like domain-containing protein [Candidatus Scalindua sp.]|nr:phospholipase D-like domain-containing protein [Candidatus Scalindua sp.]
MRHLEKLMVFACIIPVFFALPGVRGAYSLPADDVILLIDNEYYPEVHQALNKARKSIVCVMFLAKLDPKHSGGDEHQLVLDLINAHKRGVNVQVIFDQNIMFWEKGRKKGALERKSEYAYDLLATNGVPVFYDGEREVTHSKVLVIDEYITIIGSTNWTYSALRKNHEASVLIKSTSVARAFTRKLARIKKCR